MANQLENIPDQRSWHILVGAAKQAASQQGLSLRRIPGRGRSNVWDMTGDGKSQRVSIRTTRDRWIAFPPLNRGKKWKTLDDVDAVMVAAVDDRDDPRRIEVYLFDAGEVRKRFDANYAARIGAGLAVKDNFGMWVGLDTDKRGIPASVGSGLAAEHKPIAVFDIVELLENAGLDAGPNTETESDTAGPETIGTVIDWARHRIARLSGVPAESVKLDLKIEY